METRKDVLVVFTRYPEPGKTKTRLIPELGAEKAAQLQSNMTAHVARLAKQFAKKNNIQCEIRYWGGTKDEFREWLGDGFSYIQQSGGDLGEKMNQTFVDHFNRAARRVVIIGSDCPFISEEILQRAFHQLTRADSVIGPAHDGGYYLIGLRLPAPCLFNGIEWGSGTVFEDTLQQAHQNQLSHAALPTLNDIDLPADLELAQPWLG